MDELLDTDGHLVETIHGTRHENHGREDQDRMTRETGSQALEFENRWPAPVRFAVYGAVAAALALVLVRLAAWQGLENGILNWHGPDRPLTLSARPELWTRQGLAWLAADVLCLFPWALAAFARSPRLAPRGAVP